MDISSLLNPQGKEDNQETAEFAEVPFSSTPRFPQTGVGEHIAMAPAYSALVNGTDSSSPVLAMPLGGSAEPHVKSKWSESEDMRIIELRGRGMKWEDISRKLPGRSATSCRLHYQNYLERRCYWDEEKKTKLAVMYDVLKKDMWQKIAEELRIPWRAVEAMHWELGRHEMATRAGATPFVLSSSSTSVYSSPVDATPWRNYYGTHASARYLVSNDHRAMLPNTGQMHHPCPPLPSNHYEMREEPRMI